MHHKKPTEAFPVEMTTMPNGVTCDCVDGMPLTEGEQILIHWPDGKKPSKHTVFLRVKAHRVDENGDDTPGDDIRAFVKLKMRKTDLDIYLRWVKDIRVERKS